MDHLQSLEVHAPITASSSNSPLLQYWEERFMQRQRIHASLQDEKRDQSLACRETLLEYENGNKSKKRKIPVKIERGLVVVDNNETEQLKRFITGEMYGLDMKLVIQKTLYESDMNTNQNRLNMPIKQLKTLPHEFLTADETRIVDESKEGMEVRVVGPMLQMYEKSLWLKTWHMKHTDNYVLKTNWNNFVEDSKVLKKDTMIQVWSFRKDRQLCFAIVPVESPSPDDVA